ncbi:MAG: hypothetical protein JO083_02065 [Candidatus Eremiobacteraeota bacterium]|nr:hypothetical protein [Candidatus Eremiobacteraeota bacterium]
MHRLAIAFVLTLNGWLFQPPLASNPAPFVRDDDGAAVLRSAVLAPHSALDSLSGEEIALSAPAVAQVRIAAAPSSGPIPVLVLRTILGSKLNVTSLAVPPELGGLLRPGGVPFVSVYFVGAGAVVTNAASAIGYFHGTEVDYRSASGGLTRYSVQGTNLFACLYQHPDRALCERRGLRKYGIDTPARLTTFRKLRSREPLAGALWILAFKKHHRQFPNRLCGASDGPQSDCASYHRFRILSNFLPSS